MIKKLLITATLLTTILTATYLYSQKQHKISGAPPYGIAEDDIPRSLNPFERFSNWKRPDVPPRVGIQVGHWKSNELPEELERIRGNTGAYADGVSEWEVNYQIAQKIAEILTDEGVDVDIIPATVPPEYWADVFIAVHADGSEDPEKSGYKFAAPWRDYTKKADSLVELIEERYEKATGLEKDPNITRNMKGYYAFAWWRFDHAIHPMTTAVIAETGFLTNYSDRQMLVKRPEQSARPIAEAIQQHLKTEGILN